MSCTLILLHYNSECSSDAVNVRHVPGSCEHVQVSLNSAGGAAARRADQCCVSQGCYESWWVVTSCHVMLWCRWTVVTEMSVSRSAAGVTVFDGRIFASGGHDGLQIFNTVSRTLRTNQNSSDVCLMFTCVPDALPLAGGVLQPPYELLAPGSTNAEQAMSSRGGGPRQSHVCGRGVRWLGLPERSGGI